MVKISSQMEERTYRRIKEFAKKTNRSISHVLTEAAEQHLRTVAVRPAFRQAAEEVLNDHQELLSRLAR